MQLRVLNVIFAKHYTLLVSTLKSYFEGKHQLFKGLAIERLETEWTEYPVLHFSMAGGKHMNKEQLERYLIRVLEENIRAAI